MHKKNGTVVAQFGKNALIESENGELLLAFPHKKKVIVAGDQVEYSPQPENTARIDTILPRRSYFARHDVREGKRIFAANLDQLAVVLAPEPTPQWDLLARYWVAAVVLNIPVTLIFNKIDLVANHHWDSTTQMQLDLYHKLGFQILFFSNHHHGFNQENKIKTYFSHKSTLLVGQSGVGKSSLIRHFVPNADARIQALSLASGQGQHTTTVTRVYALPEGGTLLDSPGVRDFRLWALEPAELLRAFPEIAAQTGGCRFRDCRHAAEPDCAVKAAVSTGQIEPSRYADFLQIRDWTGEH